MINLMYIVLTAMLALNVSSDVLDGFTQVERGLADSNDNVADRNNACYDRLASIAAGNPAKGAAWNDKALVLRDATVSLNALVDSLKMLMAVEADGDGADPAHVKNQENHTAATEIMLNPLSSNGRKLRERVDGYRATLMSMVGDSLRRANVGRALSTAGPERTGVALGMSWEEALFDGKPVVAAITLLTKLQNDIRYAEGETLSSLLAGVDERDVRVNRLSAFVLPHTRHVVKGGRYVADIVLAAVDTTSQPAVYVGGKRLDLENGRYELPAGTTGDFTYSGYLEVPHGDGSVSRHDFTSSYSVVEPSATVSATMMNVLYAGIDNPVSISVPGVPASAVTATMTGGTLVRRGNGWVARPAKVGTEAVITVTADIDGRRTTVASTGFRVRKLPDPAPFLAVADAKGNEVRYKGSRPLAKSALLSAKGVGAAVDDDMLDIPYRITGFETLYFDSMGNAIPEVSDGASFSNRQKTMLRKLARGKRFFISRIKAVGPDGIERDLPPLEVIVN